MRPTTRIRAPTEPRSPPPRLRRHPGIQPPAAELVAVHPLRRDRVLGRLLELLRVVPRRPGGTAARRTGDDPDRGGEARRLRRDQHRRSQPVGDEPQSGLRRGRPRRPSPPTASPATCRACGARARTRRHRRRPRRQIWIHGGHPTDLYQTVTKGVPAKGMPTWGPDPRARSESPRSVAYVLSHHREGEPMIDAGAGRAEIADAAVDPPLAARTAIPSRPIRDDGSRRFLFPPTCPGRFAGPARVGGAGADRRLPAPAVDPGRRVPGRVPRRGRPALPPLRAHPGRPGPVAPLLPDHGPGLPPVLSHGAASAGSGAAGPARRPSSSTTSTGGSSAGSTATRSGGAPWRRRPGRAAKILRRAAKHALYILLSAGDRAPVPRLFCLDPAPLGA